MTVLVDDAYIPARVGRYQNKWCHLISDESVEELHEFAQSIGLKRSWFQDHSRLPHYDVTVGMRRKAVDAGAEEITSMDLGRLMWRNIRDGAHHEERGC